PIISRKRWNASFLNRTRQNLTDYQRYDFSRPDAVADLGRQGKRRKTVAQLNVDYGFESPSSIQRDYFAMEAWTRVRLRAGKFYRISSSSDDGMRFIFRNTKTGKTLAEFNDNWGDRSVRSEEWSQIITPAKTGRYDFYIQYYEKREAAVVDVSLDKISPTGRVRTTALNLRNTPSTLNNAPVDVLSRGETFKIKRRVTSAKDSVYRDWYRVVSDDSRGFVAANANFVDLAGEATRAVVLGERQSDGPLVPDNSSRPTQPTTGGTGVISSSVWITADDRIAIRSDKTISGVELGRVREGTQLSVIETVTGGRYLNGFDAWHRVRLKLNGRTQEGFVAAYYVDVLNDGGRYSTGISKENRLYKPHLDEVLDPTYASTSYRPYVEQAASRYRWLNPSVIAGIGSRESAWGRLLSPPGPGGTGDGGHGRGLMQIDDRFHESFIRSGRWRSPKDNIDYAIDDVLAKSYAYLDRNTSLQGTDLLRGAIAAYNAGLGSVMRALQSGRDVDYYTTGQDYSWDVLNRAGWFQLHGWR
ncbi:MAG: transglycosylase SLT domain-containing protein, partial [Cyanobacteria bacterium J06626_14]